MEEFFIISVRNIDSDWSLGDLREEYHAIEYCEQVLDIPEEYIMDAMLTDEGLEVSLCDLDEESLFYDDDWYIQLKRISNTTARVA